MLFVSGFELYSRWVPAEPLGDKPHLLRITGQRGLWPKENARVNYPVKRALNLIKEREIFNMEDPPVNFAVSWVKWVQRTSR